MVYWFCLGFRCLVGAGSSGYGSSGVGGFPKIGDPDIVP